MLSPGEFPPRDISSRNKEGAPPALPSRRLEGSPGSEKDHSQTQGTEHSKSNQKRQSPNGEKTNLFS